MSTLLHGCVGSLHEKKLTSCSQAAYYAANPAAVASTPLPGSAEHTAAWAAYAQQQAAAQQAAIMQQAAHVVATPGGGAQTAAEWEHRRLALSGPHAAAWATYYARVDAAAAAATAPVQPSPVLTTSYASYAAAASAPYAPQAYRPQAVAGYTAPAAAAPFVTSAPLRPQPKQSYNAVPPPGYGGASSAPVAAPAVVLPPPRPPAGPPPPPRPGLAAPYNAVPPAAPPPSSVAPAGGSSHGGWPPALRGWVERAFAACGASAEARAWVKAPLKAVIDDATQRGELWTRDWDATPLPRREGACDAPQPQPTPQVHAPQAAPQQHAARAAPGGWAGVAASPARVYVAPAPQPAGRARRRGRSRSRSVSRSSSSSSRSRSPARRSHAPHSSLSKAERKAARRRATLGGAGDGAGDGARGARAGRFGDGRADGAGGSHNGSGFAGTLRRRAAAALALSAAGDEGGGGEPDWDALTIRGTSCELEKSYFRLTSAPDPATVRPAPVLEAALARLVSGHAAGGLKWSYLNDQCKALRQDCTVQRLRTPLCARVYAFHGRLSLEAGDLAEFNQCAAVLGSLVAEGVDVHDAPAFAALGLLYAAVAGTRGAAMTRALAAACAHAGGGGEGAALARHAFAARAAIADANAAAFFRLRASASRHARCLMDAAVERVRFCAAKAAARAYGPAGLPLSAARAMWGFADEPSGAERTWLLAHGGALVGAGADERVDPASSAQLFVPVDDNAVSHGDAELDVSDFLKSAGQLP